MGVMMEVATVGDAKSLAHPLTSRKLQPRKIGDKAYHGHWVVAKAVHVTYQQQSTTFGRTAGVFGLSKDGDGFVTGGGGFVDTVHKGVVTAVFQDEDGAEQTYELPAAVAARVGSVARLDMIGQNVIAATNVSGKGRLLQLMDASSFIEMPRLNKKEVALAVFAVWIIIGGVLTFNVKSVGWGAILGILPAIKMYRTSKAKRERRELNGYMAEVMQ